MKQSKSKKEEKVLFKDNILVKTKYELSLVENRLYNVILYKFQKEGDLLTCTFSYDELKTVIRHKEANTIKGINDTLLRLQGKKIYVEELKENGKYSKHHNYNLIAGFSYDEEFKTFEIKAVYQVYELLRKKFQDGGYTPINMNVFLTLNNYYAQRLYDLLRLWSNTKHVINYGVEELKDYLMLKESYPAYADFKKRVIMPGIKELNKSKFFQIDIKENKLGRKVVSIDFIVKDLDKRKYFNATEIIEINNIIDNSVDNDNIFFEDKCIDVNEIKDVPKINEKIVTKKSLSEVTKLNNTVTLPKEQNFSEEIIKLFNKDFIDINFNDNDFYECIFIDSMQDFEDDNNTKEININNYGDFKVILKENLIHEFNKQVSLPIDCILAVKYKYEFLKYCYEKNINFKEVKKYALALKEAEDVTKIKKEVVKIKNKITYAYFIATFNNKLKECKNENTLSNNNIKINNNKLQFTNYSGQRHYNYDELENELLAIYQNR